MSDQNRIIDIGKPDDSEGKPVNINMTNMPGVVKITFEPPVVKMRLKPKECRALAISMLIHADQADCPPPVIEAPAT